MCIILYKINTITRKLKLNLTWQHTPNISQTAWYPFTCHPHSNRATGSGRWASPTKKVMADLSQHSKGDKHFEKYIYNFLQLTASKLKMVADIPCFYKLLWTLTSIQQVGLKYWSGSEFQGMVTAAAWIETWTKHTPFCHLSNEKCMRMRFLQEN